ncbi:MAG: hypothetical protein RR909_01740 [Bacilli bacterium]
MKELLGKIGNSEDAKKYITRITKKQLYHSDTIFKKVRCKYGNIIANNLRSYIKSKYADDDDLYVEKLKILCIKRRYGIIRFDNMLYAKGIFENRYHGKYSIEEEKKTKILLLKELNERYLELNDERKADRIYNKCRLNGFKY